MNPGMTWCREMSTLPAGYIPQHKVTSASSSGSLGFIVCVKCCRMVDSVPRWQLSLSWPIQSDHLSIADRMIPPLGWEHSHCKTQYIPGKQVLVRSWLENYYYYITVTALFANFEHHEVFLLVVTQAWFLVFKLLQGINLGRVLPENGVS